MEDQNTCLNSELLNKEKCVKSMSVYARSPQISGVMPVTVGEWLRNLTHFDHQHHSLILSISHPLFLSLLYHCPSLPLSTSVFLFMSNQIN